MEIEIIIIGEKKKTSQKVFKFDTKEELERFILNTDTEKGLILQSYKIFEEGEDEGIFINTNE